MSTQERKLINTEQPIFMGETKDHRSEGTPCGIDEEGTVFDAAVWHPSSGRSMNLRGRSWAKNQNAGLNDHPRFNGYPTHPSLNVHPDLPGMGDLCDDSTVEGPSNKCFVGKRNSHRALAYSLALVHFYAYERFGFSLDVCGNKHRNGILGIEAHSQWPLKMPSTGSLTSWYGSLETAALLNVVDKTKLTTSACNCPLFLHDTDCTAYGLQYVKGNVYSNSLLYYMGPEAPSWLTTLTANGLFLGSFSPVYTDDKSKKYKLDKIKYWHPRDKGAQDRSMINCCVGEDAKTDLFRHPTIDWIKSGGTSYTLGGKTINIVWSVEVVTPLIHLLVATRSTVPHSVVVWDEPEEDPPVQSSEKKHYQISDVLASNGNTTIELSYEQGVAYCPMMVELIAATLIPLRRETLDARKSHAKRQAVILLSKTNHPKASNAVALTALKAVELSLSMETDAAWSVNNPNLDDLVDDLEFAENTRPSCSSRMHMRCKGLRRKGGALMMSFEPLLALFSMLFVTYISQNPTAVVKNAIGGIVAANPMNWFMVLIPRAIREGASKALLPIQLLYAMFLAPLFEEWFKSLFLMGLIDATRRAFGWYPFERAFENPIKYDSNTFNHFVTTYNAWYILVSLTFGWFEGKTIYWTNPTVDYGSVIFHALIHGAFAYNANLSGAVWRHTAWNCLIGTVVIVSIVLTFLTQEGPVLDDAFKISRSFGCCCYRPKRKLVSSFDLTQPQHDVPLRNCELELPLIELGHTPKPKGVLEKSIPVQRKGYYKHVGPIFLNCPQVVYSNSNQNLIHALKGRVLLDTPLFDSHVMDHFISVYKTNFKVLTQGCLNSSLINHIFGDYTTATEYWTDSARVGKAKSQRYVQGVVDLQECKTQRINSIFVKRECQALKADGSLPIPRIITNVNRPQAALLGPISTAFSKVMMQAYHEDTDEKQPFYYAPGRHTEEISEWLNKDADSCYYIEVDMSKYDAHISAPILQAEADVLMDQVAMVADPFTTKCAQRYLQKPNRTFMVSNDRTLELVVDKGRRSGDGQTTSGNTFILFMLVAAFCEVFKYNPIEIMAAGDDSVMKFRGSLAEATIFLTKFKDYCLALGFVAKGFLKASIDYVSFCSKYFYPVFAGGRMIRIMASKPGRALSRLGYSCSQNDTPYCQRLTNLRYTSLVVPVLRCIVQNYPGQPALAAWQPHGVQSPEADDNTFAMFRRIYKMSHCEAEKMLLRDLANWDKGPCFLTSEIVEHLLEVEEYISSHSIFWN